MYWPVSLRSAAGADGCSAELRLRPQEVPARAGAAAGHVLCNVPAPGMHLDELFLVGRFCDQLGKLLCGFS